MTKPLHIGVLTAGGDCQGLNAALRGITLSALQKNWKVTGILDGFLGLAEGDTRELTYENINGIIGLGGTILGTGRGGGRAKSTQEAADLCIAAYKKLGLDALICLGGDGTQRFSLVLHQQGLKVVTLPKTIDNDISETDITFGYDTAVQVSVTALDRLRTTGDSHHRLMVLEVMGRDAGWLAASAALAGGADICLIPEIPFCMNSIAESLKTRALSQKSALLVVAEGAICKEDVAAGAKPKKHAAAMRIINEIPELTGIESRLTTLGYVSRGGTPTAIDRIFATQCGIKAVELVADSHFGVMVASKNGQLVPVEIEKVAGNPRLVPHDHALIHSLRNLGVSLGE